MTTDPLTTPGLVDAASDAIIAMDGDLQHDPNEIPKFVDKIKEGFDVVSIYGVMVK